MLSPTLSIFPSEIGGAGAGAPAIAPSPVSVAAPGVETEQPENRASPTG